MLSAKTPYAATLLQMLQTSPLVLQTNYHLNSSRPAVISISSCQRNLMKTYHNEANTSGITKIALKFFLEFFEQSS